MTYISLLLTVGVFHLCRGQLSLSDYVTNVIPDCPQNVTNDGVTKVVIVTDLPSTEPYAICIDDWDFPFDPQDDGTWSLDVYFPGSNLDASSYCIFNKKSSVEVYSIKVVVPLTGTVITYDSYEHIVICSYDKVGTQDTGDTSFLDSGKPVEEIQDHMAEVSASNVELCTADVLQNCITGRIRLGKTIMLKAELIVNASAPDEQSFQALSCKAVGPASEYPILVGGCGDGVIIPKNRGFTTEGTIAKSPFFKSFRLPGSRKVTFQCNFIVCKSNCDGSSCDAESRKRRDTSEVINTFSLDPALLDAF